MTGQGHRDLGERTSAHSLSDAVAALLPKSLDNRNAAPFVAPASQDIGLPAGAGPDVSRISSRKLAEEGMTYLSRGEVEKAQRLFNAAVKFDGQNGDYHFLVAVTYHLQYLASGSPEARDNAFAGYQIAYRMTPGRVEPLVQMGRLYMENKSYEEAAESFAAGVELKPKDPQALYGLSSSSYMAGDVKTALWSAQQLEDINWNPAAVERLRALTFSAAGNSELATKYFSAYAARFKPGAPELSEVRQRMDDNANLLKANEWLQKPGLAAATSVSDGDETPKGAGPRARLTLAKAAGAAASDAGSAEAVAASPAPEVKPAETVAPASTSDTGKPVKQWFDCGPGSVALAAAAAAAPAATGADETLALPALPSTCVGAPSPKMVVIDAVLLRTEDQVSRSYGLNVLQGLTGFFGYTATHAGSATKLARSSIYGFGGPSNGSATATPINYSLNIANATDNRNEVLARPALLAIDRLPSTFFSGNTVSIAVSGVPGAVSQLVDKQIGVSFSITPTFIDEDHVLLAVKAARSFIEPPAPGTTGVALSVSRQAVSASVVATFGETIVLSGLTERELIRAASGVPMLRDIPGIQYMFSSVTPTDYFRTIMIMITLRKPVGPGDVDTVRAIEIEKKRTGKYSAKKYAFYWRINDYDSFLNRYAPNLDSAIDNLQNNQLYKSFRGADLVDIDWAAQGKLANFVHEMKQTIFH